jgi:hypothetical protein
LAGGGGTVLLLLAGYFALKWTRRIWGGSFGAV